MDPGLVIIRVEGAASRTCEVHGHENDIIAAAANSLSCMASHRGLLG